MSRTINSFFEAVQLLDRGRFVNRVNEHWNTMMQTLEAQVDEKGEATITLTVKIKADSGSRQIMPTVKSKLPEERANAPTTFWAYDGGLSLQHPSQIDMFPRDSERASERGVV